MRSFFARPFAAPFAVFAAFFLSPSLSSAVTVSNAAELQAALNAAAGGETIVLNSGAYGEFVIRDKDYGQTVTLRSAEGRGAVFQTIDVDNASRIRIERVTVQPGGREGIFIFDGSEHVAVVDSVLKTALGESRRKVALIK